MNFQTRTDSGNDPIAIIGMGCRFPGGANNSEAFWKLLLDGVDAIGEVPVDRWDVSAHYHPDPAQPGKMYTLRGAFLDKVDLFDAEFFGISPREAASIDPQHRLLLEVAWEALEDAGQVPQRLAGTKTGVFIGICSPDYGVLQKQDSSSINPYSNTGAALSIAANRISYIFDFHGPSFIVDTACSSSLVAIHLACESLWKGESTLALAGGVHIMFDPLVTVGFCKASMLSRNGRCSSFDAQADGFVRGEGAGVVILKPLSQALADGDPVYAVIRATAVNQDGRTSGIALPNEQAQEALLHEVYNKAGIAAEHVQYVEAHGTGTPIGDPIECNALGKALGEGRSPENYLRIGSVKTNIGHLEGASGMAGLIKTVLSLKHRQIPANLHFQTPNPRIPFDDLHLQVQQTLEPWPENSHPRIAGVNSFGFGGTNAHVVLQEFLSIPEVQQQSLSNKTYILPISARSSDALRALAQSYRQFLLANPSLSLYDLCYTASLKRDHHTQRLAVVGQSQDGLVEQLEAFLTGERRIGPSWDQKQVGQAQKIAFVFSGNGPQWWAMGRQLLELEPIFREVVQTCDSLLQQYTDWSLLDELMADEASSRMHRTDIAQPALFALQIALVALWRSWGVEPQAVIGHSVGEIAAAYVAGALSLEDAILVIFHRSRVQEMTAGKGKMLAIGLSFEDAQHLTADYEGRISIASINSPKSVTLSGDWDALEVIMKMLEQQRIFCRLLPLNYAFHSHYMDPTQEDLLASLQGLQPQPTSTRFISTVTGQDITDYECNARYWWHNIRQPVQFAAGIEQLIHDEYNVFLEIGPHPVLSSYIVESLQSRKKSGAVLPSLRRKDDEQTTMLASLGALYTLRYPIDWSKLYTDPGSFIPLFSYPWQRESHWFERVTNRKQVHPLLGSRLETPYPSWKGRIDTHLLPYLQDHQVQGATVFPAAGYIEIGLAAAGEIFADGAYSLEEFEIRRPLVLNSNHPSVLQTVVSAEGASFSIYSQTQDGRQAWMLHAIGQLHKLQQPKADQKIMLHEIRKRCSQEFPKEDLYRAAHKCGLQYGPSFRGLERVWSGKNEAVGIIQVPEVLTSEVTEYKLHPAVLDACFHVIIASMLAQADNGETPAYLPIGLERLHFYAPPNTRLYCHARLVKRGSNYLKVDCLIFDEEENIHAEMRGFRLQAVDLAYNVKANSLKDQLYELKWHLKALPAQRLHWNASSLPSPLQLAELVQPEVNQLNVELERVRCYQEVQPQIDALCRAYIVTALQQLGWQPHSGERVSASTLVEQLDILPQYERLLSRFCAMLEHGGMLKKRESLWEVDNLAVSEEPGELLRQLMLRYPSYHAEFMLLGRCGPRLAGVLNGEIDPLQVIFSDKSFGTAEHFYESSQGTRVYNLFLQAIISQIAARLPKDRPIRILEVGAGTGGTTSYLLPMLPAEQTEYVFTDISEVFLARAEQKYRNYPFVRYQMLDIEKDPVEQGFEEHAFDLIVASNTLHATQDLRNTLGHIQRLLASEGLLALIEINNQLSHLILLVFGLLKGFWLFQDEDLRALQPLLSQQQWFDLLETMGFTEVAAVSDRQEAIEPEQCVILARGPHHDVEVPQVPTLPEPSNWLIFADRENAAYQLGQHLKAQDGRVLFVTRGQEYERVDQDHFIIDPLHTEDLLQLLEDIRSEELPLKGILHMWSLDILPQEPTLAALQAAQELGCLSVLHLVQALKRLEWAATPRLWLITSGAKSLDLTEGVQSIAQSPLGGLGRVIFNEHPELHCTLVDVSAPRLQDDSYKFSPEEIQNLFEELASQEAEDEILLRENARYVCRAVPTSLDGTTHPARSVITETQSFRLEIPTPGVLDNLMLRTIPRPKPKADEVEVETYATGLNFKDVMQAMGILSGEALEVGYTGRLSLGLECAGRIVAVGKDVSDFQVGDEVIAFGRDCLGAFIIAKADLIVHKPAHISFEEAATISGTFMTAYYALHYLARLRKGERVLIHGAAGGVGLAAIQLVQQAGGEIFATAGSPEKREYLRSLGVQHIMNSRTLEFADEIMEITHGEGVDIVLNSLAGEAIPKSLRVLKRFGRFLEIGKRDFLENSKLGLRPFENNLSFFSIDIDQLLLENPALIRSLLSELMTLFEEKRLYPLPHRAFSLTQIVNAFRYMQQSRHIGKIVVSMRDRDVLVYQPQQEQPLKFHEDASYLITGGLGGFGIAVAQWMVQNGARHLVLLGRHGAASPAAQKAVDAMKQAGVRVLVGKVDVAQEQQVAELFTELRESFPPLRGVVHAAMVLGDALVLQLHRDTMWKAMAPKMLGAWNLHNQTQGMPLDFFVLFSSITSVIGNPGQGNYVAGNAFLDALAHYRRSTGLPALTVNWGALAEVGYVAQHAEIIEIMQRRGMKAFTPEQALSILEQLIQKEKVQVTAVEVDWAKINSSALRFTHLISKDADEHQQHEEQEGFRAVLRAAPPEERRELIKARLYDYVARVLGTSVSKLDPEKPLSEIGLDSLMAMELHNHIDSEMGVDIPIMQLFELQNIADLTNYLSEQYV